MKQKKINDILYVFQVTPYEITEDTDASTIKVQLESYDGFIELNESLASKFVKYNYEMFTVHQQEWAPYVDAKEDADLAWSSDSATAIVGETNTYPTLTNTDNVEVTYSSSDTSVASIASDGTITLLEAGTTTISAIFAGDDTYNAKTVSYSLLVKEVPDLAWSSDSATATVGETNTYPTLTNTDNVEVTYSSSDTSVASIASDGTITLLEAGTTTISAIFAGDDTYNAKTVSYSLLVKEVPDLAWSSDSATVTVGETNTYPTLTNTDNVEVTYSSSDTSVASIASDGTITLLEVGTTTISAIFAGDDTYNAKTVSYSLLVKEVPDLAWSSDSATATVGETNTYPTLTNTDNVEVTYSSSDTSVASIASDGTVTILAAGTTTISAAFAGDTTYVAKTVSYSLTVSQHDYSTDYLTTKALGSGDISFSGSGASYRKNNGEWTNYTEAIPVVQDDVVEWKGTITPDSTNGIGTICSTGYFNTYGNAMSMLFGDNFENQITLSDKSYAFKSLFNGNNKLISAKNLILPATTLSTSCYFQMFRNCASLTTAPALPATSLTQSCYGLMFLGCTMLTTAPELSATTLTDSCYINMFNGCRSLTTPPALPATTLQGNCYKNMFKGCTSLATAPQLLATTLHASCYESMFEECTSLTTPPALPATTLSWKCYNSMFSGCTSLITPPVLPATTLDLECYNWMFGGCTSLTTAPSLPATTLVTSCYANMFRGCTSLNNVTCLATDISASGCVTYWLTDTAASGTFYKDPNMTGWVVGTNVPSGWTIEDYSDDPSVVDEGL